MSTVQTRSQKTKKGFITGPNLCLSFPEVSRALAAYVENHLNYPQQAVDDNTTGTVRVSFVVDEHGKVIKPHVTGDSKSW